MLLLLTLACNPCPDDAVCLDDGWFLVDEPQAVEHTVLWLHGWNEDAYHLRGRAADHQALLDAGFRIVSPQGSENSWNSQGSVGRNELKFLSQVVADIDGPILVAGHSVGASMASELACGTDVVHGLAAMHGTFWDPIPTCEDVAAKPVRHVHGSADETWPMDGRDFFGQSQGSIPEAVEMWRDNNVCGDTIDVETDGPSTCTVWHCSGAEVRYCEHDGEHRMLDGFGERLAAWWIGAH